ncbi:MAG: DUF99 family protein [Myxococcales bacterium]|nr:DUF99 family protein [Myxococcales bacterium]
MSGARRGYSNVVGVDDGPFVREHRGDVPVIATITTQGRLDGLLVGKIRRDGRNATERLAALIGGSRFHAHVQAVLLQGIALGGFNVVDIHALADRLRRPVLVVARRAPDLEKIERALRTKVPGGARKWRLIEAAGPMEAIEGVWVQRAGLDRRQAAALIRGTRVHGALPEPLRLAHLIAAAFVEGQSRGRA